MQAAGLEENNKYNLAVFSNESLFLANSRGIQFIIMIIRYFTDRENILVKAGLLHIFVTYILPETLPGRADFNTDPELLLYLESWHLGPSFNDDFVKILAPSLEKLFNEIQNNSIDEAIIKTGEVFRLFDIEAELPYIQTLIDRASDLKQTTLNDFSGFIKWWDEKGSDLSVMPGETTNAIRLLTIHTAKGLEFDAVLVPFLNWSMNHPSNHLPVLWCQSELQPFIRFKMIPVRYSKALRETFFAEYYTEEYISNLVDNLNLVYVALTRAKSELYLQLDGSTKTDRISNFLSIALGQVFEKLQCENRTFKGWDQWVFGQKETREDNQEKKNESKVTIDPGSYHFTDFSKKLKFRQNSEDFIVEDGIGKPAKNLGKLVHEILSGINTVDDISESVQKALSEKKFSQAEADQITGWLNSLVSSSEEAKEWFSGKYRVLNERSVLNRSGITRPDRVMIQGSHAVIVDYKIGEIVSESHFNQVKGYADDLKEAGFSPVTGYLWYLRKNRIEKVCGP